MEYKRYPIDADDVFMDGDPNLRYNVPPPSTEGHVYDLEMDSTNENVTLTEDGADKTELPLVPIFTRTREEWDQMTVAQKTKYRLAIFSNDSISYVFSHVGQIIESTTLDTEAKVKNVYGAHTSWIQHSGYVLRGAESGVTANQHQSDGGADNVTPSGSFSGSFSGTAATLSHTGGGVGSHTLTTNEMPSHNHGGATGGMSANNPHNHAVGGKGDGSVVGGNMWHPDTFGNQGTWSIGAPNGGGGHTYGRSGTGAGYTDSTNIAHTHSITAQGGGQGHSHPHTNPDAHVYTPTGSVNGSISMNEQSNLPKYKSIYIWERIA